MTARPNLHRPALAILAAGLGMALAPLGVAAQGEGMLFRAQLAAPAGQENTVAGGVVWRCAETSCTAPRTGGRPLRMCRELKRELGPIVSFEVAGVALASDELERCNA